MRYHWQLLQEKTWALYPEGESWDGTLNPYTGPAMIHQMGPFAGGSPAVSYQVSGSLFEPAQVFDSFDQAKQVLNDSLDRDPRGSKRR
ncbi:MAG: hypothetical protein ACRDV4_03075 [Acidimicrobiales bacterium]